MMKYLRTKTVIAEGHTENEGKNQLVRKSTINNKIAAMFYLDHEKDDSWCESESEDNDEPGPSLIRMNLMGMS